MVQTPSSGRAGPRPVLLTLTALVNIPDWLWAIRNYSRASLGRRLSLENVVWALEVPGPAGLMTRGAGSQPRAQQGLPGNLGVALWSLGLPGTDNKLGRPWRVSH